MDDRNKAGFTLVETMVVIAITMVISTMLLTYNRSSEKQIVLFRDQAVLVGFLNRAKSLAIEKFNKEPRVCAFGIYFPANEPNKFILFQDLQPADSEPTFGCRNGADYNSDLRYGPDEKEKMESFTIDSRLKFEGVPGDLNIVFIPPELAVKSSSDLPVSITIKTIDGSGSASIVVGEAGQIVAQ